MNDTQKTCLSCSLMGAAFVLPLVALGVGWVATKDWKTGGMAMVITFGVLFLLAGVPLMLIRQPSAVTASLPFAVGLLFSLIPSPIPIPIDSILVTLAGSVFSSILWWKRWPAMPKWLIGTMLLCAAYNLIGGFILGPFDEIIAYLIILGSAGVKLYRELRPAGAGRVIDLEARPAQRQGAMVYEMPVLEGEQVSASTPNAITPNAITPSVKADSD